MINEETKSEGIELPTDESSAETDVAVETDEITEEVKEGEDLEPVAENAASDGSTSEGDATASKAIDETEIIGIRFKKSGKIYYFDPHGVECERGGYAVVETARGVEYGMVVLSNRRVPSSEIVLPLRQVLRMATPEDKAHHAENLLAEKEAFKVCLDKIHEHEMAMKLIDVEYTFDNNKLLFYFTAEGRVDFRDLVKDLAGVFRTRIELRQIGIRDEAKLMGGLGVCGRSFCCHSFLGDFAQVSIKMAKEQNLSLNSNKISGACGRLMCCLRYENDVYEEEARKLPKLDSIVQTTEGDGIVIEVNALRGRVRVKLNVKPEVPPKYFNADEIIRVKGVAFNASSDDDDMLDDEAVAETSDRSDARSEREKFDRRNNRRRGDRGERTDRMSRGERPERGERPDRGEKLERAEKPERGDRPERVERGDRNERAERSERRERPERNDRRRHQSQRGEETPTPPTVEPEAIVEPIVEDVSEAVADDMTELAEEMSLPTEKRNRGPRHNNRRRPYRSHHGPRRERRDHDGNNGES